ncbi:ATP-binding protein [Actinomadura atramentaria]|uniref:ATP-binding protein n=1 Tax=Actinomadura atramentaria TaxID=1990 RepID=UPI000368310A|nr:ATP-binding protein [Actinomadura atramentaria]
MEPERGLPPARPEHNIAMWGPPGSGKTTFLAALHIALNRRQDGWKVVGANGPSTDALIRLTGSLATQGHFPAATRGIERYRWYLVGAAERAKRFALRRRPPQDVRIGLDLLDPSGELFDQEHSGYAGVHGELVDNLVNSRGIVFLFDPVREFEDGDAFDYLHGVLSQLANRMLESPEFADGMLPHHVAVCITKFDEIRVMETAEKLRLVTVDPDDPLGFPKVEEEDARDLFRALCGVSATGNAELVHNTLIQYFRPERVRFFVTSAVGFYVDPRVGRFDRDDYQNLLPEAESSKAVRVRGTIHPINVVEPLLWLGRSLAAAHRAAPAARAAGTGR